MTAQTFFQRNKRCSKYDLKNDFRKFEIVFFPLHFSYYSDHRDDLTVLTQAKFCVFDFYLFIPKSYLWDQKSMRWKMATPKQKYYVG